MTSTEKVPPLRKAGGMTDPKLLEEQQARVIMGAAGRRCKSALASFICSNLINRNLNFDDITFKISPTKGTILVFDKGRIIGEFFN